MSTNPPKDVVEVASHDLFGCPFCGDAGAFCDHSEMEHKAGVKAHVECANQECRCFGPDGLDTTEAIAKWNRRAGDPYEREAAKAAVNTLVRENERLRDARAKAENGECLLELTVGMMEQDIATIREIITKGGTAADILKFLDTPNA